MHPVPEFRVFESTDEDGDRLEVDRLDPDGGSLLFTVCNVDDNEVANVWLPPAEVARLREALTPYDPGAKDQYQRGYDAGLAAGQEAGVQAGRAEAVKDYVAARVEVVRQASKLLEETTGSVTPHDLTKMAHFLADRPVIIMGESR